MKSFFSIFCVICVICGWSHASRIADWDDVATAKTQAVQTASAYTVSTASGTLAAAKAYTDTGVGTVTGQINANTLDISGLKTWVSHTADMLYAPASLTNTVQTATADIASLKLWQSSTAATLFAPITVTETLATATANIASLQSAGYITATGTAAMITGTISNAQVSGLGTAALTSSTAYDAAGAASAHAALTGTAVHGLGTAATVNTGAVGAELMVCGSSASAQAAIGAGLIASYTVPQESALSGCTYDSASKTFTKTGHGLLNGYAVMLLANGGSIPSGFSAFTSVFTGPVYYVINKTSDTFQLSASAGSSAVVTSDSGSSGWTATLVSRSNEMYTISGLSIGDGKNFTVEISAPHGVGYGSGTSSSMQIQINGISSAYRYGSSNETVYFGSDALIVGNVMAYAIFTLRVRDKMIFGIESAGGASGTDNTQANSSPTGVTTGVNMSSPTAITVTSIGFIPSGTAGRGFKPGTKFMIKEAL